MAKTLPARVKAAVNAVEKAAKAIGAVEFDPDGTIRIVLRTGAEAAPGKKWSLV